MSGKPTQIHLDKDTCIDVRCQIHQMSFSPHTDAKGIMDLIGFLSPKYVILVHGEKPKMAILKGRIESEHGIPCFYPANNETVTVPTGQTIKIDVTKSFLINCLKTNLSQSKHEPPCVSDSTINHEEISKLFSDERTAEGILIMEKNKLAKIVSENDLLHTLDAKEHKVQLAFCCPVKVKNSLQSLDRCNGVVKPHPGKLISEPITTQSSELNGAFETQFCYLLELLLREIKCRINCCNIQKSFDHLQLKSFQARICLNEVCSYRLKQGESGCKPETFFCCSWSLSDDILARKLLSIMREVELDMSSIESLMPGQMSDYMEM